MNVWFYDDEFLSTFDCRDATAITVFSTGAVLGEAGLPMITGVMIDMFGYIGLPYIVIFSTSVLCTLYCSIHRLCGIMPPGVVVTFPRKRHH